ncbi:MAG: arginine repressor, partial [Clostridia bacterium]|nr:arginine repressor [Clostridia bacterium]
MKNKRQEKILELIAKYEIETHDDMISRLRDDGYNVTQATISRDMRELKLTKVLTSRGTYKYTVNNSRHRANNVKFNNAVVDSIVSVDYAGNN